MNYKIIFSDIDGTIINNKHVVTKRTKNVLNSLKVPIILVSARMPQGMRTIQKQLENMDPIICYSGALIMNKETILYDRGLREEDAEKIYRIIKECSNVSLSVYSYDEWYTDQYDEWIVQEEEITSLKANVHPFDKDKQVHKFLCIGDSHKINALERILKERCSKVSIYKSKPTYLEIMSEEVSKSAAIEYLLDHMSIQLKDSLSFGDNYNDIDMLEKTGMSFVMGNAPKEIKKRIQRVTRSNDEDGIVYAIENLL